MGRIRLQFLIVLLAVICIASPSFAQKRVALVIGNSKYTSLQSLANPGNDSQLMAQTLSKLGFDVVSASDVDFIGMRRAVKKFGRKLRSSGKDTVGLFYYAGHGVQAQGANFLVPLGAEIDDVADLEIETIAASDVLAQMEAAGNTLNLVILDACRNNPFKGKMRSSSRGLARLNAASGSLVAFAAAPGQVAADGSGENSPYTKALVAAMQVPGLSVEQMFKRVRIAVEAQTNNQQTPWEESSLRGDFFFTPEKEEPVALINPLVKLATDPAALEWVTIQNTQSIAVLETFIARHPDSIYTRYARVTLKEKMAAKRGRTMLQTTEPARKTIKLPKETKITSLPTQSKQAIEPALLFNEREMTLVLQQELTRVGCNPGQIDGQWGTKGRRALARFKQYAKLTLPSKDISIEVIDIVKQQQSRVCPKIVPVKTRKPSNIRKTRRRTKAVVDWKNVKNRRDLSKNRCVSTSPGSDWLCELRYGKKKSGTK